MKLKELFTWWFDTKVSRSVEKSFSGCCYLFGVYLEDNVVTDAAHFDLVLIHSANVLLHLDDTSGGQAVFTLFLNSKKRVFLFFNMINTNVLQR